MKKCNGKQKSKFVEVTSFINNAFKCTTRLHNILAKPTILLKLNMYSQTKIFKKNSFFGGLFFIRLASDILCYGNEAWTLKKKKRMSIGLLPVIKVHASYSRLSRTGHILKELKMVPVPYHIHQCQNNWLQHVSHLLR